MPSVLFAPVTTAVASCARRILASLPTILSHRGQIARSVGIVCSGSDTRRRAIEPWQVLRGWLGDRDGGESTHALNDRGKHLEEAVHGGVGVHAAEGEAERA